MNQAAQQQQQQSKAVVQDQPTTYFLYPEDTHEKEICLLYIQQKYPNSKARRVSEFELGRLTDANVVIVLRRPERRSDAVAIHYNQQTGVRGLTRVPYEDLVGEVKESKPIDARPFWVRESDEEWADGRLERSQFMSALGAVAIPARLHVQDGRPGWVGLRAQ